MPQRDDAAWETMRALAATILFVVMLVAAWFVLALVLGGTVHAQCTPDPEYTMTPTIKWDAVPEQEAKQIYGYRLYWDWWPSVAEPCCWATIPCETVCNEDTGECWLLCPGADTPLSPEPYIAPHVPPQRFTNTASEMLYFKVKAVKRTIEAGEVLSDEFSNEVAICMPPLRRW